MRTTVNIEEKALAIVKARAEQTYQSMGQVISQMVYDSAYRVDAPDRRNGVPLFRAVCHGAEPGLDLVNRLRDD